MFIGAERGLRNLLKFVLRNEVITVGGQAVIEGVMMRSPTAVATAVRRKDDTITVHRFPFVSLTKRAKFWGLPVVRGAVSLVESLYLGIKTLNWSANQVAEDEGGGKKNRFWEGVMSVVSIIAALAAALALFMLLPYWVTGLLRDAGGSQFIFHAAAGAIRIFLFLLYLFAISRWKEIRRVFEYHGAEHKSIFAFEKSEEVSVKSAREHSRFHPRCGTSFLLITAIVIIFLFAVLDSIIVPIIGEYRSPLHRLLIHIPFIPLVAGLSYEVLKLSGRKQEGKIWSQIIKPGLWLQHITTKEPDESQLEVAVAALEASLNEKSS